MIGWVPIGTLLFVGLFPLAPQASAEGSCSDPAFKLGPGPIVPIWVGLPGTAGAKPGILAHGESDWYRTGHDAYKRALIVLKSQFGNADLFIYSPRAGCELMCSSEAGSDSLDVCIVEAPTIPPWTYWYNFIIEVRHVSGGVEEGPGAVYELAGAAEEPDF